MVNPGRDDINTNERSSHLGDFMKQVHGINYKDRNFRKKFGICIQQYNQMLHDQHQTCYICQLHVNLTGTLAVDHCHSTQKVRGLLCKKCNQALGQLRDNVEALQRAIIYLTREYVVPGELQQLRSIKPHRCRARWRYHVKTPEGDFASFEDAAKRFGVHPTTIRAWCGIGKIQKFKRDGFTAKKYFEGDKE